jgi:hypothetical protein
LLQQRLAGLSLEDLEDARGPDSNRRIRFVTICSISAAGMRSPAAAAARAPMISGREM